MCIRDRLGGQALARRNARWRTWSLIACSIVLATLFLLATPVVVLLMPPGPKQNAALLSAQWAAIAGDLIIATALGVVAFSRVWRERLPMHLTVSVLSVGVCAALVTLAAGTNTMQFVGGGPAIAETMRPYLREETPFYCVGMYPQTVTFALARTCTLVAYHGEMMPQFDDGQPNWIESLSEFTRRWQLQPGEVAIVDPAFQRQLAAEGLPATVLARTERAVAIIRQ